MNDDINRRRRKWKIYSHDRKYIEEVCATTYTLTEEGLNKEYFTRIR